VISRPWRLVFPTVRVEVREVEGPAWPEETRITRDLEDLRFQPATPNVVLENVTARRVDFSGLRFWIFAAEDCRFIECDFSRVEVEWLPFANGDSLFRDCRFDGARIGDFGDVRLDRCQFVGADLEGWFTRTADLVDCRFAGRLSRVVFNGRDVEGSRTNEFVGNDFREADLDDVDFRDIDLDAQLLPQGDECIRLRDLQERVNAVRKTVKAWPQDAARAGAEQMLSLVESVYEDESDVFTKRSFLLEMADFPELGERVLDLIREGLRSTGAMSGARHRTWPERLLQRGS
jgi:hypothetical protein